MFHKPSPLPNKKVPKTKPIFQHCKSNFNNNLYGIPPTLNGCISIINLFPKCCILVLIVQCFMLFMQLWLNLLFCVSIHGLNLMKITSMFLVHHWFIWVIDTIHNLYSVPIGLNTICHEVWMKNTIFCHHLT